MHIAHCELNPYGGLYSLTIAHYIYIFLSVCFAGRDGGDPVAVIGEDRVHLCPSVQNTVSSKGRNEL